MKSLGAAAAKDWEGAEDESGPTKNEEREKSEETRDKREERKNRGREMEDAFLETPDERRMTTKMHRKGG